MTKFDAIVIGGGLNGLVAATVLARRGKSVCLLEQATQLGGMAAPAPDGHPCMAHLLYNLSPAVRRDIGMDPHKWPFELEALPTVALAPDQRHIVIRGRDARYADGSEHPESESYRKLVDQLTRYGALLRQLAEAPPPGGGAPLTSRIGLKQIWRLARLGLSVKRMDKPEMRRFLQVLLSNAYDLILDEMTDGPLAGVLAADAVRGAAAGPRGPGTVFGLIYRMGHGGVSKAPAGGMGAVVDAFARAAQIAGVEMRTSVGVEHVLTENDRVCGVETTKGDTLSAPLVLSSTGPMQAVRMTGAEQFDIETTRRIRKIRARGTAAKINLTLRRAPTFPGLTDDLRRARFVLAPSADYVERAFNPSKYREMSSEPVIEAIMPSPTSMSIITQYAPVDLSGGWGDAARAALLKTTLGALAPSIPDLADLVVSSEVITPDKIAQDTGAPGGHWHHAEMTLDQLLSLRPANGIGHYALGPAGLYLCGASAHPGGDLMGLAGRNAALRALEDRA